MNTNTDLESIFSQAIGLSDAASRGDFLDDACDGNVALRNRVSALLDANQKTDSFMGEPAGLLPRDIEELAPESSPIGEQAGDMVGRYKLLQQIGEGGMGTVFMAEQVEPVRRRVALKIVKPGLDTKEVIGRFESERQSLALMNHPNIAQVLDGGTTAQGRPFFVMELVKGITITDYCNEQRLTTRDRLQLFAQVCDAIQHAHQKGVIHRDIKPSNVMITEIDGEAVPKVIDFGIAKAVDQTFTDKTVFTRYGEFIGTPSYMSPEQAALSGTDVDTRSDVYSLGALLYELLTDAPPFPSEQLKTKNREEMCRVIREELPRDPSDAIDTLVASHATTVAQSRQTTLRELRSQLRGELDWVVIRSLEKSRERRYPTATAFADDVRRYLQNEPVLARPVTTAYRLRKFIAKHRSSVVVATAMVLTLLLATLISSMMAIKANREREIADGEVESLGGVVNFINDSLLALGDPAVEADREIRLRTVLDQAAHRLDQGGAMKPRVEASIRSTIGQTYYGLGEYPRAVAHLRRAHELDVANFSTVDRRTVFSAIRLASALMGAAEFHEVGKLLDVYQPMSQSLLGSQHEWTLELQRIAAARYEAIGELDQAQSLLEELSKDATAGSDLNTKILRNLASVYQSQGRLDEALNTLKGIQEGIAGRDFDALSMAIANSLASIHVAQGDHASAANVYESSLPLAERVLGGQHAQTLTAKHGFALTLYSRQEFVEAERLLREVLEAQRANLGQQHPNTLATMHNLARLLQAQRKLDKAEDLLRTELKLRLAEMESSDPLTLNAASSLAFLQLSQGDYEHATNHYKFVAQTYSEEVGQEENAMIAQTMWGLCLHKSGNSSEAKNRLLEAKRVSENALHEHWLPGVVASLLGEIHQKLGDRLEAESALLDGYESLLHHDKDLPATWKPMGLRAATRRLAEFYESATDSADQARAKEYRDALAAMRSDEISTSNGRTRNTEDGFTN